MHRTLTALILASLASGALLLVATVTLDAWHWRLYNEAQALQPSVAGLVAAAAENPYQLGRSATTYFQMFVGCCAATTFWVVFVVLPGLLAARRIFSGVLASHIIAAIVACAVSGITFTLMQRVTPYISPMITFAAGGTIGLVSTILLAKMLPPNTSLERTREV